MEEFAGPVQQVAEARIWCQTERCSRSEEVANEADGADGVRTAVCHQQTVRNLLLNIICATVLRNEKFSVVLRPFTRLKELPTIDALHCISAVSQGQIIRFLSLVSGEL